MPVATKEYQDGKVIQHTVYKIEYSPELYEALRLLGVKIDETHSVSSITITTTNF
jgi:hypothetical protein